MNANNKNKFAIFSILLMIIIPLSLFSAASLIGLGDLAGGPFISDAASVTNDGSMVVGESAGATGFGEGFYWTSSTGMVGMGVFSANSISNNYTVVGNNNGAAYSWTQSGGFVGLGTLTGSGIGSIAYGVSSDGSVIVGRSVSNNASPGGYYEAFRWTQSGGMVGLGDLPGGLFSSAATGVSADGSVVIGGGINAANQAEAFRWTESGGMTGLGNLSGGIGSMAYGISANGNFIVGVSGGSNFNEAFRWTQATGMVGIGFLNNDIKLSEAFDVSADGNVIVGGSNTADAEHATIWTPTDGMKDLLDLLIADGVDTSHWKYLEVARTVSDDGNWIAGTGVNIDGNNEAFLAQIPEPETYALVFGGAAILYTFWRKRAQRTSPKNPC